MNKYQIVKRLEYCVENKCDICQEENGSGFPWIDGRCYGFTERLYDALTLLKTQEPVVHGRWSEKRWMTDDDWGVINHRAIVCSACKGEIADGEQTRYCPNCGAKMDKEK